jgi:ABC-2 type transport system ATP-binding protein
MRTDAPPLLEAVGLRKRYGNREALKGVTLDAREGELVACIGPNGAGKTTLLTILAGIQRPDAGTVEVAGRVGWVPQQPAAYGRLSVAENLRLFARLERVPDVDAAVESMLAQIGLADRAADQLVKLSGGNRQRVNVAIGLLGSPPVLLLDEPSAALDPRQRERLWDFLGGLAGRGTTVVYSTHMVSEARRYATKVAVLADGELLFEGTPGALERLVAADGGDGADFERAFVSFLRQRGH